MVERNKSILFGGLLCGAVLAVGLMVWRRKKRNVPPKLPPTARWKPIGHLKNLLIFPLKSGGYAEVEEAECTEMGPAQVSEAGLCSLKDRNFIVYRYDTKETMLCMTYPIMVSIKVLPHSENTVLFKFRDKPDLLVKIPTSDKSDKTKAKMWTEEIMDLLDCGDEAADWLTDIIKGDKNADGQMRLGYWAYPDKWTDGRDENYNDRGAFQNYTSYMLMTSSSINDIARRIPDHPLTYKQFRPNFYVETTVDPFSEDRWTWVKIGEEAIFLKIKDCYRCSQININPETAKFNKNHQPLNVLLTYRQLIKSAGPIAGICMGLYKAGKVKVGDPVYIAV